MNPGPGTGRVITSASPRTASIFTSGNLRRNLLHGLDLGLDLGSVPDKHAAGLERLVPSQAEVLPVDRSLRRERGADVAPRVLRLAVLFDAKHHLARDAPDGQIADHIDLVTRSWLDARADETQFGILRGVEEIRRLEMSIAVRDTCLDARGVDRHRDGGLGEVAVRHLHGAGPARERPAHFRDHQVPHRKVQARMAAVDLPTLCAHKSSRSLPACLTGTPCRNRSTWTTDAMFSI